jgi:hypothetical protein
MNAPETHLQLRVPATPRTCDRMAWSHAALVAAIFLIALLLRGWNLGDRWPQRDEAESGINALTILEHGIPVRNYLGMPVYENTLVKPWPDNSEYEFRDSSYSDRGIAIYHGWLPLYVMAATFRATGVRPDLPQDRPRVMHDEPEMRARTRAARLPAVLFAGVFLAAVYAAGCVMSGRIAGASAMAIAAFAAPCVEYGRQARYYSAALAFGTLAFLALWQLTRRGTWGSYGFWASSLLLLFFSYAVAFAAALGAWLVVMPWALRRPDAVRKSLVAVALLTVAIVPWLVLTGAIHNHTGIPPARSLLVFPRDYAAYLAEHLPLGIGLGLIGLWLGMLAIAGPRLANRFVLPFQARLPAAAFALTWVLIGFLAFVLVVPASSLFMGRVKLGTVGPVIVLVGILLEAGARAIAPTRIGWLPVLAAVAMVVVSFGALRKMISPLRWREPGFRFVEEFPGLNAERGTKIYALPLDNLALTFAAGLPVQSIAPVRKSFLDQYPGRVLIIDSVPRAEPQARSVRTATNDGLWQNPAMFKGFESYELDDFWGNFFYRFVDPASRTGSRANFAERISNANRRLLPSGWVVYDCPPRHEMVRDASAGQIGNSGD